MWGENAEKTFASLSLKCCKLEICQILKFNKD